MRWVGLLVCLALVKRAEIKTGCVPVFSCKNLALMVKYRRVIKMVAFGVQIIFMAGILLSSFYVFTKSIHYIATMRLKVLGIAWCLLLAGLYAVAPSLMPLPLFRLLMCAASIIAIFRLTRLKFEAVVSAYLLAFGISYALNYLAMVPLSITFAFLLSSEIVVDAPLDYSQPIYLLIYSLVSALQFTLAFIIFRIKRFRNGFPFIFKRYTIVIALIFTGLILILVTWVNMLAKTKNSRTIEEQIAAISYIAGILIAGGGIFILIRRLIRNYQKMRVRQNTESLYEKMYFEEKAKYEELKERYDALEKAKSAAVHSFTHRIRAMEEANKQGKATQEDIHSLQNDWQGELDKLKGKKPLPSTKINGLDILFAYYAKQFASDNIVFNLMLDGSIKYMIDHVVKQGHLETLITNHLNDAQIAVNASDKTYRCITAMLRLNKERYEFTVFDSGIPFEIDTLIRLGTERVTTHADTGGSGIGFETTFEIMREYSASLIINEQEESNIDFSKSVSIRFDNKNQYIIETYRPSDFPANERYIIVGHQGL